MAPIRLNFLIFNHSCSYIWVAIPIYINVALRIFMKWSVLTKRFLNLRVGKCKAYEPLSYVRTRENTAVTIRQLLQHQSRRKLDKRFDYGAHFTPLHVLNNNFSKREKPWKHICVWVQLSGYICWYQTYFVHLKNKKFTTKTTFVSNFDCCGAVFQSSFNISKRKSIFQCMQDCEPKSSCVNLSHSITEVDGRGKMIAAEEGFPHIGNDVGHKHATTDFTATSD